MLLLATSVWKHGHIDAKDTMIQKYTDLILFQTNSCYSLYKYSEKFPYDNVVGFFCLLGFYDTFDTPIIAHNFTYIQCMDINTVKHIYIMVMENWLVFRRKHVYPLNKITNISIFTEKVLENLKHTEIILQLRCTKFLRKKQHTQELYWNNPKKVQSKFK